MITSPWRTMYSTSRLYSAVRAQRRVQVMHQTDVGGVVQALAVAQQPDLRHQLFDLLMAVLGQRGLLGLLVDRVIAGTVFGFLPRLPSLSRGIRALILM